MRAILHVSDRALVTMQRRRADFKVGCADLPCQVCLLARQPQAVSSWTHRFGVTHAKAVGPDPGCQPHQTAKEQAKSKPAAGAAGGGARQQQRCHRVEMHWGSRCQLRHAAPGPSSSPSPSPIRPGRGGSSCPPPAQIRAAAVPPTHPKQPHTHSNFQVVKVACRFMHSHRPSRAHFTRHSHIGTWQGRVAGRERGRVAEGGGAAAARPPWPPRRNRTSQPARPVGISPGVRTLWGTPRRGRRTAPRHPHCGAPLALRKLPAWEAAGLRRRRRRPQPALPRAGLPGPVPAATASPCAPWRWPAGQLSKEAAGVRPRQSGVPCGTHSSSCRLAGQQVARQTGEITCKAVCTRQQLRQPSPADPSLKPTTSMVYSDATQNTTTRV